VKIDLDKTKTSVLRRIRPWQWRDMGLGRLMVVEIITGGGGLRAMILRRAGITIEVEAMVQAPPGQGEALDHGLSTLIPLFGKHKLPKDVLLLTDEARFIPLEIDLPKRKKGSRKTVTGYPDSVDLREKVYQEVEPYLDVRSRGRSLPTGRLCR